MNANYYNFLDLAAFTRSTNCLIDTFVHYLHSPAQCLTDSVLRITMMQHLDSSQVTSLVSITTLTTKYKRVMMRQKVIIVTQWFCSISGCRYHILSLSTGHRWYKSRSQSHPISVSICVLLPIMLNPKIYDPWTLDKPQSFKNSKHIISWPPMEYPNDVYLNCLFSFIFPFSATLHHGGFWRFFVHHWKIVKKFLPFKYSKKTKFSENVFNTKEAEFCQFLILPD